MANSGLRGPYSLTTSGVAAAVTNNSSPGAYALGDLKNDVFQIAYIGRSDSCVATRLQQHVATRHWHFKFDYFPTVRAAFEKECQLYHDFTPIDNACHPAKPANQNVRCPVCGA